MVRERKAKIKINITREVKIIIAIKIKRALTKVKRSQIAPIRTLKAF